MFDGLTELLLEWLKQAFCWFLQAMVDLAVILQGIYATIMPSVGVPAALKSTAVSSTSLEIFLFFFPGQFIVAMLIMYITIEFSMVIMIPLFRSLYDLL